MVHTGSLGSALEIKAMELWQETLKMDKVGYDDTFVGLGGYSLKAVFLSMKVQQQLMVDIPVHTILNNLSFREFLNLLQHSIASPYFGLRAAPLKERYKPSHAQATMLASSQVDNTGGAFNIFRVFRLKGSLDVKALGNAFLMLLGRHEILRTGFQWVNGEPFQFVRPPEDLLTNHSILFENCIGLNSEAWEERLEREANFQFNIEKDLLIRVSVFQMADGEFAMAFLIHHLVADGWSLRIIWKELLEYYNSLLHGHFPYLSDLKIQYKDFSEWQAGNLVRKADDYKKTWTSLIAPGQCFTEILCGPCTHESQHDDGNAEIVEASLLSQTMQRLRQRASALDVTPHALLLTAFTGTLSLFACDDKLLFGCILAGREHYALIDQVGLYANILPMAVELHISNSFSSEAQKLQSLLLKMGSCQYYPVESIITAVAIKRKDTIGPLFKIVFQMFSQEEDVMHVPLGTLGISVEPLPLKPGYCKYDLLFSVYEEPDQMRLEVTFRKHRYSEPLVKRFLQQFVKLLEYALAAPQTSFGEIILSAREMSVPTRLA